MNYKLTVDSGKRKVARTVNFEQSRNHLRSADH